MKRNSLLNSTVASIALLTLLKPLAAHAETSAPQWEQKETIMHRASHQVTVELNEKTVLCSRADYSFPMLKVLIPGLADITLLNHQNTGAGAPCMTTGETCGTPPLEFKDPTKPLDRIGGNPGTEVALVEVTEKRVLSIDHRTKTCEVSLFEELEMNLRGKKWFHVADVSLGQRPYSDCVSK